MRVLFLLALLSALAFTGCGNRTISVKGRVIDEKGQPVSDAEVRFTGLRLSKLRDNNFHGHGEQRFS